MHVTSRLLCLWPGLAGLWTKGDWPSLVLAIGFSILLNLALISSLIWPELLGRGFPTMIWPILAAVWIISAIFSHHQLSQPETGNRPAMDSDGLVPDTLFIQAQREYLKGHLSDAEKLLKRRLQFRPRDAEARLLLATLFRHLNQTELAAKELETLERFDESKPWAFEITNEKQLIESIQSNKIKIEDDSVPDLHLRVDVSNESSNTEMQKRAA